MSQRARVRLAVLLSLPGRGESLTTIVFPTVGQPSTVSEKQNHPTTVSEKHNHPTVFVCDAALRILAVVCHFNLLRFAHSEVSDSAAVWCVSMLASASAETHAASFCVFSCRLLVLCH